MMIDRTVDEFGGESWTYRTGCFQDGHAGKYMAAVPGEIYSGSNIRIEVRDSDDPYIAAVKVTGDDINFSTSFGLLGTISFLLLLAAIVMAGVACFHRHNLVKYNEPYAIQNDAPVNA
jgi:hypothetical protein